MSAVSQSRLSFSASFQVYRMIPTGDPNPPSRGCLGFRVWQDVST